MENTTETTCNHHISYYKDKFGIHFIYPFIDKSKKILSIENSSVIVKSPINAAVIYT